MSALHHSSNGECNVQPNKSQPYLFSLILAMIYDTHSIKYAGNKESLMSILMKCATIASHNYYHHSRRMICSYLTEKELSNIFPPPLDTIISRFKCNLLQIQFLETGVSHCAKSSVSFHSSCEVSIHCIIDQLYHRFRAKKHNVSKFMQRFNFLNINNKFFPSRTFEVEAALQILVVFFFLG